MKRIAKQYNIILRFFREMIPERKSHLIIAFFAGLSEMFFNLLLAYVLKGIYTAVMASNAALVNKTICLFVLMIAGTFGYNCIFWQLHGSSVIKITGKIRQLIFSRLCHLRLPDVESHHSGDIMTILTNDLNAAQGVYSNIRSVISSVLLGIVSITMIFSTSWLLGTVITVLAIIQLLINLYVIKPLEMQSIKIREDTLQINITLSDILRNNAVIRLYCSEDFYIKLNKDINDSLYKAKMKLNDINTFTEGVNVGFGLLGYIIVLITGSFLICQGKLNLPDLLFITQMRLMMVQGILAFGSYSVQIQPAMIGVSNIMAFMDHDIEKIPQTKI